MNETLLSYYEELYLKCKELSKIIDKIEREKDALDENEAFNRSVHEMIDSIMSIGE